MYEIHYRPENNTFKSSEMGFFLFGYIDKVRPLKIYKYCILIHAKKPTNLQKILGTIF